MSANRESRNALAVGEQNSSVTLHPQTLRTVPDKNCKERCRGAHDQPQRHEITPADGAIAMTMPPV